MLEKMDAFFASRLAGYEEHQLTCIDSAQVTNRNSCIAGNCCG